MTKIAEALTIPQSEEIRTEALEAIIEKLGVAKAAFFLRETISGKTDYVKIKENLFGERRSEELYDEIIEWKEGKR